MAFQSCLKHVLSRTLLATLAALACGALRAEVAQVAVAANFAAPMKSLAPVFEAQSGHKISISTGATAKFYSQIKNAAPFDVFLAADESTPARLESEGAAAPGSRFTYAVGRLVLWSAQADFVDDKGEVLKNGKFANIALASPQLAPYGLAAVQALTQLQLLDALRPKFVLGESIGQAYSFVATGNAALGFVALSQVFENGKIRSGSGWIVPAALHAPIRQDAVLLARGSHNPAALAFMRFLKSDAAKAMIRVYGYEVPA